MKIKNIITSVIFISIVSSPLYAGNDKGKGKHLPPGLQKKAMHGEALPRGWKKKLAKGGVMDKTVYSQSQVITPLDTSGLVTVRIDGKLVKLVKATREIVEVLE